MTNPFKSFLKNHIGFGAVAVLQASHLKPRRHADPPALMKKFEDRQVLIDAKRAEDGARAAFTNSLTRRQRKTLDRIGGPPYGHTLARFSIEQMKPRSGLVLKTISRLPKASSAAKTTR